MQQYFSNTVSFITCNLLLILIVSIPLQSGGDEPATFSAACVKIDITPDRSQWLHGYAPRESNGVRDHIFHRIAALRDGDQEFFLVSTDVCTISPSFYDQFAKRMQEETGIPADHLWWTTTHTHSAPHLGPQDAGRLFEKTLGDRFSIPNDEDYWKWTQDQLLAGIKDARSKLQPARLGIGVSTAAANVNRREKNSAGQIVLGVNPTGPVDRQLNLIRLETLDGKLIGLIANYAIHGTTFNGENQKISGDVTGIVADYVESNTGVPMLFINGAEGNVAPLYSVGPAINDPVLQRYKSLLGDVILDTNSNIKEFANRVEFKVAKTDVLTPRKENLGWIDDFKDYARVSDHGENLIRLPIFTLTLNEDTVIWGAPLELFSEIAIKARENSPFKNTFYFGLTNGSLLYLPTAVAFTEGGYEPSVSLFSPKAENDITEGVDKFLKSLK
jgi:hypothetical protein